MPFDATPEQSIETRLIDEMLKILGPGGEHWFQGLVADKEGNFCMQGALHHARDRLCCEWHDDAKARIMEAIRQTSDESWLIEVFNDARGRKFSEVRKVLELAKIVTVSQEVRDYLERARKAQAAATPIPVLPLAYYLYGSGRARAVPNAKLKNGPGSKTPRRFARAKRS